MLRWQARVDAYIPVIFFKARKRCQVNAGLGLLEASGSCRPSCKRQL